MKKFFLKFLRFLTPTISTIKTVNFQSGDFVAVGNKFFLNGKPVTIRVGELHYSRIPKIYWDQRIKTAKALGLNTIFIDLSWNFHEHEKGIFDFTGQKDVAEFVHKIQENGMCCILRPGSIVSSVTDECTLPNWLFNNADLKVKNHSTEYFRERVNIFLKEIGKQLAPYQIQNGGPIIMLQLENKFGTKENVNTYLDIIYNNIRQAGFDKVLIIGCDVNAEPVINWKVVFNDSLETEIEVNKADKLFNVQKSIIFQTKIAN